MPTPDALIHARHTLSPETSRSEESTGFDVNSERSLIGIPPAEPDEHNRGLFFYFDSWTGQPSHASASEESEHSGPAGSLEAPLSDHSTSLPHAMTPRSDPHIPTIENSQIRLNGSISSSASGLDVPGTPSASELASLCTHNSQSAPNLLQAQSGSWLSDGRTPPPMSPSPDHTSSDHVDPLEGIKNPRDTIIIDKDDIDFLHLLTAREGQGQPNKSDDGVIPLHEPDLATRYGFENGWKSLEKTRTRKKESHNTPSHSSTLVHRQRNAPRTQGVKKERRTLTEEGRKRARALREEGVCLRCLVNHETVSVRRWSSKFMFERC